MKYKVNKNKILEILKPHYKNVKIKDKTLLVKFSDNDGTRVCCEILNDETIEKIKQGKSNFFTFVNVIDEIDIMVICRLLHIHFNECFEKETQITEHKIDNPGSYCDFYYAHFNRWEDEAFGNWQWYPHFISKRPK